MLSEQGSELHTHGYEVCQGAIPLDPSVVDAIKAANYDERGLPSGPDDERDPTRQQTIDHSGASHWVQHVKALQTDVLRKRGHLKCSQGEKVVRKMHGIKSLPTPGYDEIRDPQKPQQGDQKPHADEPLGYLAEYMRGRGVEDAPLSTILAIEEGSCLRIRPFGGEWTIVYLEPGDLLIFRGDVCHNGLGYAHENVRVHAYVYALDYTPGASSINACGQ